MRFCCLYLLLVVTYSGLAQTRYENTIIDWGNGTNGHLEDYAEYEPYIDSNYIPFSYNILSNRNLNFQRVECTLYNSNYSFDSIHNLRIRIKPQKFSAEALEFIQFNNNILKIKDLYDKYDPIYKGKEGGRALYCIIGSL